MKINSSPRRTFFNRKNLFCFFLVLLHLAIFNLLFVFRLDPRQEQSKKNDWLTNQKQNSLLDIIQLFFSNRQDEAYYYELSNLILGMRFEDSYTFSKPKTELGGAAIQDEKNTIKKYFFSNPKVISHYYDNDISTPVELFYRQLKEEPHRRMPYRDVSYEYPPLMLIPILSARLLSHDYLSFTRALALILSLFYLASLYFCHRIWSKIPKAFPVHWSTFLILSLISLLFMGQSFVTRLDVIPAFFLLLSLSTFLEKKYMSSSLGLSLGILSKAYPILMAPLYFMALLRERKFKSLIASCVFVFIFVGGTNLAVGIMSEGTYWESFKYHQVRGIQIESLYAVIPYVAHVLFDAPIRIYELHHCLNISFEGISTLLFLSKTIPFLLFTILYYYIYCRMRLEEIPSNNVSSWIEWTTLLLFAFILSFKVFSPQYLIWLIPMIFLNRPNYPKIFFTIFFLCLLLSQIIFPNFYFLLIVAHPLGVLLLFIRNLLLIILFGWLCCIGSKKKMGRSY